MQNTPDELSGNANTVTRDHYIAVTHHFDIHEYHKDATVTRANSKTYHIPLYIYITLMLHISEVYLCQFVAS